MKPLDYVLISLSLTLFCGAVYKLVRAWSVYNEARQRQAKIKAQRVLRGPGLVYEVPPELLLLWQGCNRPSPYTRTDWVPTNGHEVFHVSLPQVS